MNSALKKMSNLDKIAMVLSFVVLILAFVLVNEVMTNIAFVVIGGLLAAYSIANLKKSYKATEKRRKYELAIIGSLGTAIGLVDVVISLLKLI